MGLFNGELRPEEVFPFPETMTEEQAQNTAMFIDPITRFFEVSVMSCQFLIACVQIKPLLNIPYYHFYSNKTITHHLVS